MSPCKGCQLEVGLRQSAVDNVDGLVLLLLVPTTVEHYSSGSATKRCTCLGSGTVPMWWVVTISFTIDTSIKPCSAASGYEHTLSSLQLELCTRQHKFFTTRL